MSTEITTSKECSLCQRIIITNTRDIDKWMSFTESKGDNSTEFHTTYVCPSCISKIRAIANVKNK